MTAGKLSDGRVVFLIQRGVNSVQENRWLSVLRKTHFGYAYCFGFQGLRPNMADVALDGYGF
jgi:hypothetical protein